MYSIERPHLKVFYCVRIPKTILRLNDMLGLTDLRKVVIFKVMVYYSKMIQLR